MSEKPRVAGYSDGTAVFHRFERSPNAKAEIENYLNNRQVLISDSEERKQYVAGFNRAVKDLSEANEPEFFE